MCSSSANSVGPFSTMAGHRTASRLVSDPNVSDKEARAAANCMVLHPACHDDPVEFYNLHGFYPDNLRRKWGSAAGVGCLRIITRVAPLGRSQGTLSSTGGGPRPFIRAESRFVKIAMIGAERRA